MAPRESVIQFRVCYSEVDKMGMVYNSRVLEWFERGRNEALRETGTPYAEMEARGVLLPLIEAHVEFQGPAGYDDLLTLTTTFVMCGKARLRCDERIVDAETGAAVAVGYTIHAIVGPNGKPIRPPAWFIEAVGG